MFAGFATNEGTTRYIDRFPVLRDAGHFRHPQHVPQVSDLWLSSIGIGTYLGEPDDATDAAYTDAIVTALLSGVNVIDTAINYRHQRSERSIGAALRLLIEAGELRRDEVLICTKAGYLAFDGNMPPDPRAYFMREYIETSILDPTQIAGGMHCMTPSYLRNQIDRSRRNLNLETIDLFYLHNPESQLRDVPPDAFRQRLHDAFVMLEEEVQKGTLRYYGLATWNAFRAAAGSRDYMNLFEAEKIARDVADQQHHLRFVQLPFNLAMPEAYGLANQVSGNQTSGNQFTRNQATSLLIAARRLGIAVMGSATLQQGNLVADLPDFLRQKLKTRTDAESAIQFARSAPGLTTALIGMGKKDHVKTNLNPASQPLVPEKDWRALFSEH